MHFEKVSSDPSDGASDIGWRRSNAYTMCQTTDLLHPIRSRNSCTRLNLQAFFQPSKLMR
jgi:hypothetical protein